MTIITVSHNIDRTESPRVPTDLILTIDGTKHVITADKLPELVTQFTATATAVQSHNAGASLDQYFVKNAQRNAEADAKKADQEAASATRKPVRDPEDDARAARALRAAQARLVGYQVRS